MKSRLAHILGFLLLVFIASGVAQDAATVKQEVRRISYRIRLLENALQLIPNDQARLQLVQKIGLIRGELKLVEKYIQNRQFRQAKDHLQIAHKALTDIERLIIQNSKINLQIRRELDGRINRAEKIIQKSQNVYARQLLEQAKLYREKAIRSYAGRAIFRAIEYFRLADYFAQNAIDLAIQRDASVQQLYERALMLLNEFKGSRWARTSEGQQWVKRAQHQLNQVHQYINKGRIQEATHLLKGILFELYQRMAPGQMKISNAEQVKNRWRIVNQQLNGLRNRVVESQDPLAHRLLNQAQNIARQVQEAIQQNDYSLASQKLQILVRLVFRLNQRLERGRRTVDSDYLAKNLKKEIQFTKRAIEEFEHRASPEDNPMVQFLHRTLAKAENHYMANQYFRASFFVKIVNQTLVKYHRFKQQEQAIAAVTLDEAQHYMERLRMVIQKSKGQHLDTPKIDMAQEILNTARQYFQSGDFAKAKALCDYGLRLLTK